MDMRYTEYQRPGGASSRTDMIFRIASIAGLVVLVFVAGVLMTASGIFPAPQISRAYAAAKALYAQQTVYQDVYRSDLWYPARDQRKGVTTYVRGAAQDGLTLYAAGNAAAAFLVDMDGRLVHEWRKPFSTLWPDGSGPIRDPRPDAFVHFRNAHVLPNGDLIALYEGTGDTPYGYGVVKLDRNSEVVWKYPGRAHHQLSIGSDGRIYVLTHEFVDDMPQDLGHLARPRLEDFLVVLSPNGEELMKIRLLSAVAQSRYRHMLYTVSSFALADPLHANAVDYIDRQAAARFAFGEEGQLLLSFRELGAVAVLDPDTQSIVWATRGPWIGQHDPDIVANGNILLFDNYGAYGGPQGISRVIEIDPRNLRIAWEYRGSADAPLASRIRADQQRLANGNTLITESEAGRLVEVTRAGEIVWEFINPVRGGPDGQMVPMMAWAQRLDPAAFDPGFREAVLGDGGRDTAARGP
ncbi:MAG: arylsulfotransferase family protein [Gammaproteobacteria bacterium]